MKLLSSIKTRKFLGMIPVFAAAAVLLAQSPVHAQSAALSASELNAMITKLNTELDRRSTETDKAMDAIESSDAIPQSAKDSAKKVITENNTAINNLKSQTDSIKTTSDANSVASKIDSQFEQFANSNAMAFTLKDSDSQQATADQLQSLVSDVQSKIDEAGAGGQDMSNQQDQLKGIQQLITTIVGIIASIIALIIALAMGNFTEAAEIFMTILGQLGLNIGSIDSAQSELGGMVSSFGSGGGLQIGGTSGF